MGSHCAAALLVLLALCAGCGSSSSSSSGELAPNGSFETGAPAPASTAVAPSAIPTAQLFETVLKRYREYQAAYKEAHESGDTSELGAVAMDPLLTQITRDVQAIRDKGETWRYTSTFNPRVYARSKDSTKIYVVDCIRTLVGYRYSAETGERLGGGPGGAHLFRSTLQYDSGVWKVAASVRKKNC
ncbi:hypothetical protein E1281_28180 [Actinomadura sp. KC345]|uniref:hypothetical protein n=1 Tax=Actinomadura sp. KC345 TaxID=2530371 RepID=UPI001052420A|nr:hypothetical protein [Actinomadura sp. KC345]TDC46312.1 hypothetical protein E1281_28180 [Actinomadura sp. KC345]